METHVPLLTTTNKEPTDESAAAIITLGEHTVTSIIHCQWLCKHSVKLGVKWCSPLKSEPRDYGQSHCRICLLGIISFFPSLYLLSVLIPCSLNPSSTHLVCREWEEWDETRGKEKAVNPLLFCSVRFGWITVAVEIIACPNYESICRGCFLIWWGGNSREQNQTMRGNKAQERVSGH